MSNDSESVLELSCPQCKKLLKVPSHLAGKKVKCPGCEHTMKVLGPPPKSLDEDDWLSLDAPAVQVDPVAKPSPQGAATRYAWEKKLGPSDSKPIKVGTPKIVDPNALTSATPKRSPSETNDQNEKKDGIAQNKKPGPAAPSHPSRNQEWKAPVERQKAADSVEPRNPSKPASSFDDDDFPLLAPEEVVAKPKWMEDLEGLSEKAPPSKPKEGPKRPQAPNASDRSEGGSPKSKRTESDLVAARNARLEAEEAEEAEFRVTCRVCGSLSYARVEQVGSKIMCEDCHSHFVVPPPPANKRKKPKPIPNAESSDGGLALSSEPRMQKASENKLAELTVADVLERAEREIEEEESDIERIVYEFDTRGWLARSFGFLQDPGLLGIAFGTGVMLAVVLFVGAAFGAVANMTKGVSILLQILVTVAGGVPILAATLANGLAILQSSANRLKRVREWPILSPGDWMEECMCVVWAFVLGMLPGAVMGGILRSLQFNTYAEIAVFVGSTWLLFPPLLLSMLDNQSLFQPFSFEVFGSIQKKPDAWGGFYLVSGFGAFLLFLLTSLAVTGGGIGAACAGLIIPIFLFFLFHQMGILAAQISDVTDLGFDSEKTEPAP